MKPDNYIQKIYDYYNNSEDVRNAPEKLVQKIAEIQRYISNNELDKETKESLEWYVTLLNSAQNNLISLRKNTLYRWVTIEWLLSLLNHQWEDISNYTNSLEEAGMYGTGIVCEFEYVHDTDRVLEENIDSRVENVREYDSKIKSHTWLDGYRWYVWTGTCFYRLKNECLKLKRIIYQEKMKYAHMILLNRRYAKLSQKKLAESLGTKQPKIAQYENWVVIPEIHRLLQLSSYIPYKQVIRESRDIVFC